MLWKKWAELIECSKIKIFSISQKPIRKSWQARQSAGSVFPGWIIQKYSHHQSKIFLHFPSGKIHTRGTCLEIFNFQDQFLQLTDGWFWPIYFYLAKFNLKSACVIFTRRTITYLLRTSIFKILVLYKRLLRRYKHSSAWIRYELQRIFNLILNFLKCLCKFIYLLFLSLNLMNIVLLKQTVKMSKLVKAFSK